MAKKVEIELDVKSGKAEKAIENLNKELKDTNENLDSVGKEGASSVGVLTTAFKGLGTALTAMGIGLVIAAFGALFTALKRNQQVMDGVNLVAGTISQAFTEVANVLVSVYNNVSSATENFDALGRVVSNVFTIAIAPFKLAIDSLALGFYSAQLAWEQSFLGSGDTEKIKALYTQIDKTTESLVETTKGVSLAGLAIATDFTEAVTEIGDIGSQVVEGLKEISIEAIVENVKTNEQLKKSAAVARVENQGLIEQYDRQAEQQRQIRDDDTKNIAERITANNKLKEELEEQKKLMLENVNLMIQQAQAQFDLTGLEADNIALLEAKNEKKAVEAQIEGFMSEQKSNAVALDKESIELGLSKAEAEAIRNTEERNFVAEMKENEVERISEMIKNLAIEKDIEEQRLQNKIKSYEEGTQAFQDAQDELIDYQEATDRQQTKLDKDLGKAKEGQFKETLGNIATIVGKNSKFGKAIAIAGAIQDTYAGASKAFKQAGIFGFISGAAIIAAGLRNVKKIASTKTPKPPAGLGARDTGGEATPAIPSATMSSLPPQFSTVGASGVNQLAEAFGNQPPVQAFVVSGDVTTAQELDRNIITSASIG